MKNSLVPDWFQIPESFNSEKFRLRMLRVTDVVKDFVAVMSSIDHLQRTKPFGPNHIWPTEDLSLEQNLIDLGWHQKEFQRRSSFAFTVVNLTENNCLGCVYIFPSTNVHFDAEVLLWVRESEYKNLDEFLCIQVKKWIQEKWPFQNPGYPGRDVSWEEWLKEV